MTDIPESPPPGDVADALPARRFGSSLRGLPPEVLVLAAVSFCVALGFGIVAAAIPLFAKEFEASNLEAGAVVSVFALCRLLFAPIAGRLVDRFGERLVMTTGIGIVALSSLLAGLSRSLDQLLGLRGIGGVGSAMFTVSATSLLLRVAAPDQRGRAAGAFQAGFLLGGVSGPAFGAPLIAWSIRAPFFVYAGTLVAAGTVAAVFLAKARLRDREAAAGSDHAPTPLLTALRNPAYRAALLNNFATGWSVFGVRSSLVPLLVVYGLGAAPSWTAWGLFVSSVVQAAVLVPAGRGVDHVGRRPYLRAGAALGLAGGLVLAFTTALPVFLLAMGLFGAGAALLATSSAAVVGDVIGGRGGTAVAGYQMASDAGTVGGPLVANHVSDVYSFRAAFLLTSAVSAVAFVATLLMPETRGRAAQRSGQPA
jgi:MFS family permease